MCSRLARRECRRDARVAAFRATFEKLVPGLYTDQDEARLNGRIARSLTEFASIRPAYRMVLMRFPSDLDSAVKGFRRVFPQLQQPMPIYLAHELGLRDGGTDHVGARKVMLFGADVIARIHNDDSLQPFLQHELFHLEHARHFADCDQLWCPLWQEGLATYAALDDYSARPAVVAGLAALISEVHAPCQAPPAVAPITHVSPRPA